MLPNVGRSGPGVETEAASRTRKEPAAATARPWLVLAIVLTAAFMQLVDVSIVTVAVASIQDGLDAGYAQVQWVLAGYTLAFAVLLVTGSELGDRFGRKRVFILGTAAFTLASLLCGAAGNAETLIAARLLQGLAAALMYPQVYAVIQVTFPPRRRGTAFGILGGVVGLAAITGPLVGGLLIQADLFGWTWRPVFLVNIPVGLLAVVLAARFVPESRATDAGGQDLTGVLLVTAGLALLVYPLVQGRELGWPAHLFAMAGAGVAVLALFGLYERRREGRGRTPSSVPASSATADSPRDCCSSSCSTGPSCRSSSSSASTCSPDSATAPCARASQSSRTPSARASAPGCRSPSRPDSDAPPCRSG